MTNFNKLFVEINRSKLKVTGYFLVIQVGLMLVEIISRSLNLPFLGFGGGNPSISFFSGFVAYIFLFLILVGQENTWVQNRYQLLPTSGSKIALANHLGSSLSLLLFMLGQGATDLIFLAMYGINVIDLSGDWLTAIPVAAMVLLVMFTLVPVVVTFINLLTKTISQILPFKVNKFVSNLLIFIVIFGLSFTLGQLAINTTTALSINNNNWMMNVLIVGGVLILSTIVMWFLSVGMFNRFVETKKQ